MSKYTDEDIKPVRWEEHAIERPEMYFGQEGPSAKKIADALKEAATILGAKQTDIQEICGWTIFFADIDWVFNSETKLESVESVFISLRPFPEAGEINSYRYEALTTPFSSDVFTIYKKKIDVIKGNTPNRDILRKMNSSLSGRAVGFKYAYIAYKQFKNGRLTTAL